MRFIFPVAAVAAMLSAPLAAQSSYPVDPRDAEIVEALPHPAEIREMTHALDRVIGAMLDIDVAPLSEAIDPERPYRGEETLRDMAERDDPWFEDRMRHNLYGVSAGMGRMMEAFAVLTPVLRRSLEQVQDGVADALEGYPPR